MTAAVPIGSGLWWDGWLGEAFCGTMLRELRSITVAYLTFEPRWKLCSPDVAIMDDGKGATMTQKSIGVDDGCSVFGDRIGDLYWPRWRVIIEPCQTHPETRYTELEERLNVAVGISRNPSSRNSRTTYRPCVSMTLMSGTCIDNLTPRSCLMEGYYYPNNEKYKDLKLNDTKIVVDVICDLRHGRVNLTINGKPLPKPIGDGIENLEMFYPFVDFLHHNNVFVTIQISD